jgi:hypothetical protein
VLPDAYVGNHVATASLPHQAVRRVAREYDEAQENERPEAGCLVAQSVFYTVCQSAPGVLLIFLIQLRY